MERLRVDLNLVSDAPKEPRPQDKPTEEEVWDAVVATMAKHPQREYLNHVVGYEWESAEPARLLASSEKPNYSTGNLTWYVKIYVK